MKKHKAILCVDDEPMILKSLKAELTQTVGNDYLIEIAESGEEALEIIDELSQKGIDTLLVISDWLMPNMKGDELLMTIHQKFPNMAKIMLSGQADTNAIDRVKSIAQGAFIAKPWRKEDLNNLVNGYLGSE
jgi:DNA-binding NtrC family response regulator